MSNYMQLCATNTITMLSDKCRDTLFMCPKASDDELINAHRLTGGGPKPSVSPDLPAQGSGRGAAANAKKPVPSIATTKRTTTLPAKASSSNALAEEDDNSESIDKHGEYVEKVMQACP
jgi:hypothetical protein